MCWVVVVLAGPLVIAQENKYNTLKQVNLGYLIQVTMFVLGTPTCVSVHLSHTKILKDLFL